MSRWTQCLRGMDLLNCKFLSMIWKQNLITGRKKKKGRNENKVSHNWRVEALKVFSVAAKSPNLELHKLAKGTKDWTEITLGILSSFRFIFLNQGTESQQNPSEANHNDPSVEPKILLEYKNFSARSNNKADKAKFCFQFFRFPIAYG